MLPHPTYWKHILIIISHPWLGLPSGVFPSGFPTKTLHAPLLFPIHATCHAHLILLVLTTRVTFGEEYKSQSFSLCSLLHSPVTSSLLDPNTRAVPKVKQNFFFNPNAFHFITQLTLKTFTAHTFTCTHLHLHTPPSRLTTASQCCGNFCVPFNCPLELRRLIPSVHGYIQCF